DRSGLCPCASEGRLGSNPSGPTLRRTRRRFWRNRCCSLAHKIGVVEKSHASLQQPRKERIGLDLRLYLGITGPTSTNRLVVRQPVSPPCGWSRARWRCLPVVPRFSQQATLS